MSTSLTCKCCWMGAYGLLFLIATTNGRPHEDILNLHTYTFYDWFLFTFVVISFGLICLSIGCVGHKWFMRTCNSGHGTEDELTNHILKESELTQKPLEVRNVQIIHKSTRSTLSTIYETENENMDSIDKNMDNPITVIIDNKNDRLNEKMNIV
eukprot:400458_1